MQKSAGVGRTQHKKTAVSKIKCQEKILDTNLNIMYYTKGDENE